MDKWIDARRSGKKEIMLRPRASTLVGALFIIFTIVACGDDEEPTGPLIETPAVTTGGAASITANSATVEGTVDALGVEATHWFEYGIDTDYGETTPEENMMPTPAGPRTVMGELSGLIPGTTYHFRLVAKNIAGTSTGEDASFVTLAANQTPETRVVGAPTDTLGAEVEWHGYWTGSDPDGSVVGFEWRFANHGADGTLDPPDSMGVPWNTTAYTDSVFTWSDDLGSRTFFVRAVDDRDARDPTPAYIAITH